ncbi:MAG: primosomal protein N' [Holosporaceae bacterium]|jgi:primosomal protein N' (replication factor Y)|nr:primosomal protein N' [Holosporaceae bacterium]
MIAVIKDDMNTFSVLPIGPFEHGYLYLSAEKLQVGDVVEIPLRRRNSLGVVTDENMETSRELKTISKVFGFNIGKTNYDFLKWVSNYTMIPRGHVLKMILGEKSLFIRQKEDCSKFFNEVAFQEINLSPSQLVAYQKISQNGAKPFLLKGVTGSGKTEVYLAAVKDTLQQKKQTLILFPEIALTQQIVKRIEKYFGFTPIIWNSNTTPKNKRMAWLRAISGEPCIVVGARSALFVPFKNLGIIVIDEEHDYSYKQEEGGFYNARDMAVVRGHLQKIPVILSSATPSLESYVNALKEKYGCAFLEDRFGSSKIPPINLIDMRQNKFRGFISPILLEEIKSTLSRNEQSLIYLNRRGYSPITLCKSCGSKISCPNCSILLVYHKNRDKLICHYCNHHIDVPSSCLSCGSTDSYIPFGPGIERIFEELHEKIPHARIAIASSDTISSDKDIDGLFDKINKNEIDVMIGTQILAKGHHFPNITLVGVVDGDLGLNGADMRSSEKIYQLVNQVAGRAGRSEKPGKIFVQTFDPEHPLYAALKSDNPEHFIKLEIESRKNNELPPFCKLIAIIVSGTNRELTGRVAEDLGRSRPTNLQIFGPAPAPIFLLRGRTRWRFLLKTSKKNSINEVIKRWIFSTKIPKNVKIQIDVDPISFF